MLKKISIVLIGLFLLINQSKAQIVSDAAVAGIYNFQSNGIGVDGRLLISLYGTLFAVPRVSYFPSFNNTHEYYAGADIAKYFYLVNNVNIYIFAGGYYNNWVNHKDFYSTSATQHNFTIEPGAGLLWYKGCINPFIEGRYSSKWKEYSVSVGILLHFGDCFGIGCPERNCPSFD